MKRARIFFIAFCVMSIFILGKDRFQQGFQDINPVAEIEDDIEEVFGPNPGDG